MSIKDKIAEVRKYIDTHFSHPLWQYQLGVSGGKDSTACYLLFKELELDYIPVFADTGNEHPDTVAHAMSLADRTGGPEVIMVKQTYTEKQFEDRRRRLQEAWTKPHRIQMGNRRGEMMPAFPQDIIDDALSVLHPTGNQFLDMMLLHGMTPLRNQQFCTLELKLWPVRDQILQPMLDAGRDIVTASGVRADESAKRKDLPIHEEHRDYRSHQMDVVIYRPILDWKAEDCFAMHRRHGVEPNPLYKKGMARVGCLPCIHASQVELVEIYKRFPEEIDRIEQWERTVAKVSRWAAFHGADVLSFIGPRGMGGDTRTMFQSTHDYIKWVGDKPKVDLDEEPRQCSSIYGLCE